MIYPIGLLLGFAFLALSANHLGQEVSSYYDFVGLTMVVGGSIALAIVILPWEHRKDLFEAFKSLFVPHKVDAKQNLEMCLETVRSRQTANLPEGLLKETITEGLEMIELGIAQDSIESILRERIHQRTKQLKQIANSLKSLAKYPPALGLMGTVIGLVSLMRGISNGLSAQETGLEMSVALIATFYGLIVANFLINPAGEALTKKVSEEAHWGEIGLQTVLLISEKTTLLESQEVLNSFVRKADRVNILKSVSFESEELAS